MSVQGGVTKTFLRNFRRVASRLSSALAVLKYENIIHSDIKPENIFFRWGRTHKSSVREGASGGERTLLGSNKRAAQSSDAESSHLSFDTLPYVDFDVTLGDFGNAFHVSEVSKFYQDFDVQSMPYRSPEVLLGVPFSCQIDIWSLGVVLLELILGRPLFCCGTREELFRDMTTVLSTPPLLRFAGGKYTQQLFPVSSAVNLDVTAENKYEGDSCSFYSDHIRKLYGLFVVRFENTPCPPDLLHFVAGMLHPDPDLRLSAVDLLTHDFLAGDIPVPRSLITGTGKSKQGGRLKYAGSIRTLRSGQRTSFLESSSS